MLGDLRGAAPLCPRPFSSHQYQGRGAMAQNYSLLSTQFSLKYKSFQCEYCAAVSLEHSLTCTSRFHVVKSIDLTANSCLLKAPLASWFCEWSNYWPNASRWKQAALILQQVLWLWVNLVRNIKACDMLGHRSRYVWGLSQVPVNTSAVQLSRMDNVAAIHSEWHHGLLYMGFTLSQLSQPFATVSFSLSEGKFRHSCSSLARCHKQLIGLAYHWVQLLQSKFPYELCHCKVITPSYNQVFFGYFPPEKEERRWNNQNDILSFVAVKACLTASVCSARVRVRLFLPLLLLDLCTTGSPGPYALSSPCPAPMCQYSTGVVHGVKVLVHLPVQEPSGRHFEPPQKLCSTARVAPLRILR
ncbi:hypothetical protein Anapl_14710 [Anas platyrhynchos]|uniref:Uncharacterized protein n=1 Tax=Anas platyrhynchos TaxID=8839 RepID=R0KTQ7_ANAPL|nr:hypothetical protein Anapl_14710 [Anas platyrhynchos]